MWQFNDSQAELWDKYVPSNMSNHLFFDTPCSMRAIYNNGESAKCENDCLAALSGVTSVSEVKIPINGWDWQYSFLDEYMLFIINGSDGRFSNVDFYNVSSYYQSAVQEGALDLSIKYCLAEPLDRTCYIAVSPTLLMCVTICVIVKTCTATLVTSILVRRKQTPLVTLGDAMASFIEKPDPVTFGMCTFGQDNVRRVFKKNRHTSNRLLSDLRQWLPLRKRRGAVVPISVWLTSYLLFAFGIAVCATCFTISYRSDNL